MPLTSQHKAEDAILTDPVAFARVMADVRDRVEPLLAKFANNNKAWDKPLDPMNLAPAYIQFVASLWAEPEKLLQSQEIFMRDWGRLVQQSARKFMGQTAETLYAPDHGDRRFRDEAWQSNALFDFIKQSYLLTGQFMSGLVKSADGLEAETRQKVDFVMRQCIDAMSPANFLLTNPEALRETVARNGENLVRGMENLLRDLERGGGSLKITTTDYEAFEVGRNLAVTPGKVVFRNHIMELIQYAPSTETVFETPLIVVPPWINKYYILDLRPENSLVKYLVDQGHTVFMVSWVNPGPDLAHLQFDDYMKDGLLEAMRVARGATDAPACNLMGYCLGGTLTTMTLAWLAKKKRSKEVRSATLLTTLIDFENAGDLKLFMDDKQLDAMEQDMAAQGYLSAESFRRTFSLLRANDMVWSFVVNNYLMGREPFPFDLLYWNDDATNMPAAMHGFYLRKLYRENLLAKSDALTINGAKLDVGAIETPCYFLSTREDHIAPWKATFAGAQLVKGPTRFVLAASGHVAGVVNPPSTDKYCYWTTSQKTDDPSDWLNVATQHKGSWWIDWKNWQDSMGITQIAVKSSPNLKNLADAPGRYVRTFT